MSTFICTECTYSYAPPLLPSSLPAPLEPRNTVLDDNGRTLTWQAPSDLFGERLIHYEILVSTSNDPSTAMVIASVNGTSYTLKDRDLTSGSQNFIWVSLLYYNKLFTVYSSSVIYLT